MFYFFRGNVSCKGRGNFWVDDLATTSVKEAPLIGALPAQKRETGKKALALGQPGTDDYLKRA